MPTKGCLFVAKSTNAKYPKSEKISDIPILISVIDSSQGCWDWIFGGSAKSQPNAYLHLKQ